MRKGKVVASTDEYTIYQRRDDRYAVKDADGNAVNGTSKIEILLKHKQLLRSFSRSGDLQTWTGEGVRLFGHSRSRGLGGGVRG